MTPQRLPVAHLRHLRAAVSYTGNAPGGGACVQRAAALVLDLRGAELVFGTFSHPTLLRAEVDRPGATTRPFIHAWVEWRGSVYSPTLHGDGLYLNPIAPQEYYGANNARDIRRVPAAAFERIARQHRLSAAFKHTSARAGSGAITDALLAAAGVRWTITPERALIPQEEP